MVKQDTTLYPPSQTGAPPTTSIGHNLLLVDQQFVIRAERAPAALAAVQEVIGAGSITISIEVGDGPTMSVPFQFSNEQGLLAASTLEELLEVCGFTPLNVEGARASAGDIVGLVLDSEFEYTEEHELFKLIAPFVEPGYLEFRSDNDSGSEHWRYNFNGSTCVYVSPRQVWPPYHPQDQPGGEARLIVPERYLRPFLESLWANLQTVSLRDDPLDPLAAPHPEEERRLEEDFYLWRGGVPLIEEDFYLWHKGTPLLDIWGWFHIQYAAWGGVVALMQLPGLGLPAHRKGECYVRKTGQTQAQG
jgi:hypothetical protein